jgi:SPP1 gp7 family putative phage head morphogenesis protein
MINFNFIDKIFPEKEFRKILLDRVLKAFHLSFKRTNDLFDWKSEPSKDVLDYFKQRELILSEKTMSKLHGNLKYELLEGIRNRESITEIIKRITPLFDGMERFELERIARTETINAFNAGEFQAQVQSGVTKWKIWKANINNKRTSADSLRLHNQIQKIQDPFIDPLNKKECMHSPNRPNCRCTIIYLFELPKNIKRKNGIMYLE